MTPPASTAVLPKGVRASSPPGTAPRSRTRPLGLPIVFTVILAALSWLPSVRQNANLVWSLWGACATLLVWSGVLWLQARTAQRPLTIEVILRKQHYLQACAQGS